MTVEKFIEEYKNAKDKEKFMKERIIFKYLPFQDKFNICGKIVDATSHRNINGKMYFVVNSRLRFLYYTLALITNYTDIEIEIEESRQVECFNLLDQEGLIDIIMRHIPESEIDKMDMMMNMTYEDMYENERTLNAWIDKNESKFGMILESFINGVESVLKQVDLQDVLNGIQK